MKIKDVLYKLYSWFSRTLVFVFCFPWIGSMNTQRRDLQVFIKLLIIQKKGPMCGLIALTSKHIHLNIWSEYYLCFQCWSILPLSCRSIILSITSDIRTVESEVCEISCLLITTSVAAYIFLSPKLNNFHLSGCICRYLLHLIVWDFLVLTGWDMISPGLNALMCNVSILCKLFFAFLIVINITVLSLCYSLFLQIC